MTKHRALALAMLIVSPAVAGCAQPSPAPAPGDDQAAADCPTDGSGFLAIGVQEGGLAPHPEVYVVRASGLSAGVVLSHGEPSDGSAVGVPERALHNVSSAEVREILQAADVPDEGRWNVTMAFQGQASRADHERLCRALTERAPNLEPSYPHEKCRDGTTLAMTLWTPDGVTISQAYCEGGLGTPFEEVQQALRNATTTARDRSGAPS